MVIAAVSAQGSGDRAIWRRGAPAVLVKPKTADYRFLPIQAKAPPMPSASGKAFWDFEEADLAALARSLAERLSIPPGDLANVRENLRVLVEHARIVAAAAPPAAPSTRFEP